MGQPQCEASPKLGTEEEGVQYDCDSTIGIRNVGFPLKIEESPLTCASGVRWERPE